MTVCSRRLTIRSRSPSPCSTRGTSSRTRRSSCATSKLYDACSPATISRRWRIASGRPIWRASEARDEADAVNALNEILGSAKACPRLVRNRTGWKFEYVGRDPADTIGANAAASLLEAIRDDGWDRFGTCDAAPCCCVYVDRSKNRRRRYCSQPCTDRAAHAAFRRRRRAGG